MSPHVSFGSAGDNAQEGGAHSHWRKAPTNLFNHLHAFWFFVYSAVDDFVTVPTFRNQTSSRKVCRTRATILRHKNGKARVPESGLFSELRVLSGIGVPGCCCPTHGPCFCPNIRGLPCRSFKRTALHLSSEESIFLLSEPSRLCPSSCRIQDSPLCCRRGERSQYSHTVSCRSAQGTLL